MTHTLIPAKTALVVDDSMLIRHTVCRYLEERGFIVEAATNGVEALKILDHFIPDVIITDLSMPRMGGAELVANLRERPELAEMPILILSARRQAEEMARELPDDISAVIFKDIDIEEQLVRALVYALPT
jgi:CheY-like chemotaxis protein